jgi:hypothetical protein
VVTSVINQPIGVAMKFNTIVKIHKYKGFHDGHHFILMAMEVHNTLGCDMDCFIKEYVCLFHDRWLGGHLSLSFYINFFKQLVNVVFQCVLAFAIKRNIVLVGNVCSRPPITIRYHDLHVSDIRKVVGEITFYHGKD